MDPANGCAIGSVTCIAITRTGTGDLGVFELKHLPQLLLYIEVLFTCYFREEVLKQKE